MLPAGVPQKKQSNVVPEMVNHWIFVACPRGAHHISAYRLLQIQCSDFCKGRFGLGAGPVHAVFGAGAACRLLSERASCDMACAVGAVAVAVASGAGGST